MDDPATLPPARERNRYGIRTFDGKNPPSAREALLDRVELRVRGAIRGQHTDFLDRFVERVSAGGSTPPLFGRAHRRGARWEASCLSGSTISSGKLVVNQREMEAWVDLTLVVNPTRTLAHLLDRYDFDEIAGLDPSVFFDRLREPSAANRTLDRRDNMVSDYAAFSGSVHATFLQRVATYLEHFEEALKRRIIEELCPPEFGYLLYEANGSLIGRRDDLILTLEWSDLTLSQCEVCWERHDVAAVEKMHFWADQAFRAARSLTISAHELVPGTSIGRELGALSVKVPIVSDRITLAVYAKAVDRLRFEVRFNKDLPEELRHRLPGASRTLMNWFDAVREEAALRVPWGGVLDLMSPPPPKPNVSALVELLEAVADVTDKAKSKRSALLHLLLEQGAVTATNRNGNAPSALLERLAARGVIEHIRLIGKDAKIGRRYRLAPRLASAIADGST